MLGLLALVLLVFVFYAVVQHIKKKNKTKKMSVIQQRIKEFEDRQRKKDEEDDICVEFLSADKGSSLPGSATSSPRAQRQRIRGAG